MDMIVLGVMIASWDLSGVCIDKSRKIVKSW